MFQIPTGRPMRVSVPTPSRTTRAFLLLGAMLAVALVGCSGGGDGGKETIAVAAASTTPTASASTSPTAGASGTASLPKTEAIRPGVVRRVIASTLGVDHGIEIVGVVNNEMQAPVDGVNAVGWYSIYDSPGSGGNSIFSAHETWNHEQGPFYGLHRAARGDEIVVEMVDGQRYRYSVISNDRYSVDTIPMAEILWPTRRPKSEEWITLLTCGGRIVYNSTGFGEYLDRDVVVARRIG